MNIFEKLKNGEPVDMTSEEYKPAVAELIRANMALYKLNHSEPTPENMQEGFKNLFEENYPNGATILTPTQIDFPKQIKFGNNVFINHSLTCMSIGGIEIDDNVQIGPNVTIVTDNHDATNRMVLKCKKVHICKNAWIGACASIMPGVTIGENAIVSGGAVVTKDVPANAVVGGNPAKVIKMLS